MASELRMGATFEEIPSLLQLTFDQVIAYCFEMPDSDEKEFDNDDDDDDDDDDDNDDDGGDSNDDATDADGSKRQKKRHKNEGANSDREDDDVTIVEVSSNSRQLNSSGKLCNLLLVEEEAQIPCHRRFGRGRG